MSKLQGKMKMARCWEMMEVGCNATVKMAKAGGFRWEHCTGKNGMYLYISLLIIGDTWSAWWQFSKWCLLLADIDSRYANRAFEHILSTVTHTLSVPSNNILFNLGVLYVVVWIGRTSCIQRTPDAIVSALLSTKPHGARALHVYLGFWCSCHPFLSLKISC